MAMQRLLIATLMCLALIGCSPRNWKGSVPAESRPTPAQPGEGAAPAKAPADDPEALLARVTTDTTWTGQRVRRCLAQDLLPDAETTVEATLNLMRQTRRELVDGDLRGAESSARRARQLAESLRCT
jgi:hypothetical protein